MFPANIATNKLFKENQNLIKIYTMRSIFNISSKQIRKDVFRKTYLHVCYRESNLVNLNLNSFGS